MFENNFGDTVLGVGALIAALYNGVSWYGYVRRLNIYTNALKTCEDSELKTYKVDDYLNSYDTQQRPSRPVVLEGLAVHRDYQERLRLGSNNSEDFKKLDFYVKTSEISHGFLKDIKYHTAPFYLDGNKKVLVDLDDENSTTIAGTHAVNDNEKPDYLYLPLYMLGLTSVTSYNVEYLSATDSLSVCGVVNYNIETSEFSIADPLVVFIGAIKEAIEKIKEKIFYNLKWGIVYGSVAAICGGIWIYQFYRLIQRNAISTENAVLEDKCISCLNNVPRILRRPCMHICEWKYCYEISKQRNLELNKQCPRAKCGVISTQINEIRSE